MAIQCSEGREREKEEEGEVVGTELPVPAQIILGPLAEVVQ